MTSSAMIASVMVASAQSVAKVYVIGAVGYAAVKFPRSAPFLPYKAVGTVARFGFHAFVIPLIFTTTAISVSPSSVGDYWFVVAAAFVVMGVSYATATVLSWCIRIGDPQDFAALRISATFPNIVALPILIFPSLCEYPVVYEGFFGSSAMMNAGGVDEPQNHVDASALQQQCNAVSNTMIFCYFFSWSLAFWSLGHRQLIAAAQLKSQQHSSGNKHKAGDDNTEVTERVQSAEQDVEEAEISSCMTTPPSNKQPKEVEQQQHRQTVSVSEQVEQPPTVCQGIARALQRTVTAPAFVALVAGFIAGCIPPLKSALFGAGGALRFLGSALETLGSASQSVTTMVVAASLVPQQMQQQEREQQHAQQQQVDTVAAAAAVAVADEEPSLQDNPSVDDERTHESCAAQLSDEQRQHKNHHEREQHRQRLDENPIMSDPNFGPHRPRCRRRGQLSRRWSEGSSTFLRASHYVRSRSVRLLSNAVQARSSPEQARLLLWFVLSRLIVSPAIITGAVVGLDCGGFLSGVPALSKLVIIINACLPGALIVVVCLKSNDQLADSAAAVAKVYLPSYLLSIVTIAAWTALGLWIALPDPDTGASFCGR